MREILFRGKCGKKWVEGDYITHSCLRGIATKDLEIFPVKKDTVSQFIWRTDKNGKKVFDGDVISYQNEDGGKDYFLIDYVDNVVHDYFFGYCLVYLRKDEKLKPYEGVMFSQEDFSEKIEVVGNRWDMTDEDLFKILKAVA